MVHFFTFSLTSPKHYCNTFFFSHWFINIVFCATGVCSFSLYGHIEDKAGKSWVSYEFIWCHTLFNYIYTVCTAWKLEPCPRCCWCPNSCVVATDSDCVSHFLDKISICNAYYIRRTYIIMYSCRICGKQCNENYDTMKNKYGVYIYLW